MPSVKMGSLPKELQHIKSVPSNTVIGDTRKRLIPKSIYPAKKRAHSGSRQRSRSPPRPESKTVARSMNNATNAAVEGLRANMENSAQQMAEMRNRLENAETR